MSDLPDTENGQEQVDWSVFRRGVIATAVMLCICFLVLLYINRSNPDWPDHPANTHPQQTQSAEPTPTQAYPPPPDRRKIVTEDEARYLVNGFVQRLTGVAGGTPDPMTKRTVVVHIYCDGYLDLESSYWVNGPQNWIQIDDLRSIAEKLYNQANKDAEVAYGIARPLPDFTTEQAAACTVN